MLVISVVFNAAVLWVILYYVVGSRSVPSFTPLIVALLFVGFLGFIIRSLLGDISILLNFIMFTGVLTLFFHIDFKRSVISVLIFEVVSFVFSLLIKIIFKF